MAKKSAIERNDKRKRLVARYADKRAALRDIIRAKDDKGEFVHPIEERFRAQLKLAELPRNSAPNRVRNRCGVTGRPRAYYRKLNMSRIALREFAGRGLIPGMVKSSW